MRKNPGLAKLRAGGVSAGPGVSFGSPDIAEQAASVGFEWVWLDWQHGQWTESALNNALARFLAFETAPIVRVKGHELGTINRVLDMGAMGVIVPMVQNAEQARYVAQAAYYPPLGMRSVGGMRLGLYADGTPADYQQQANDEIMLVVMVETEEAIGNVTEIMNVPGVDAALIGPADLMIDVKANGHDESRHEELVLQVVAASRETGVAAGYVCQTREEAYRRVEQGFRFVVHGSDRTAVQTAFREAFADTQRW